MSIKEITKKYKNEWLLVEILQENKERTPVKVRLLAHSKNRDDTSSAMVKYAEKYTYHFHTGDFPKKNYAVAF